MGYWSNKAFKCYCGSFFIHTELSPFYGIIRDDDDDDTVERRKLGVNKERTTVALKGFIWSISHIKKLILVIIIETYDDLRKMRNQFECWGLNFFKQMNKVIGFLRNCGASSMGKSVTEQCLTKNCTCLMKSFVKEYKCLNKF